MSDTLDLINTVRIADLQTNNTNRDMQYDLDKRAERLERKTGTRPMDWDEFQTMTPAEKPESTFVHIAKYAGKTGALMGGVFAVIGAVMDPPYGILGTAGMGTVIGGLFGGLIGLVDDQKPEIRQNQLKKYSSYLDDFEKAQSLARAPQVQHERDDAGTKWRDRVEQSKHASHEQGLV